MSGRGEGECGCYKRALSKAIQGVAELQHLEGLADATAAAVGSLMIRSTVKPANSPASRVAWR